LQQEAARLQALAGRERFLEDDALGELLEEEEGFLE
jgi:hypothetical protein